MSNIEKIRQEIERRIKSCDATSKTPNQLLWAELSAPLSFVDSLQQKSTDHPNRKVLLCDLDGTLIVTKSGKTFPVDENDWQFKDGIKEAIQNYKPRYIFIVTNQGGIEKGYVDETKFSLKLKTIVENIRTWGDYIVDGIYCTSTDKNSRFRKPNVGMIDYFRNNWSQVYHFKNEDALMIGDMETDQECAKNAGISYLDVEEFIRLNKNGETNYTKRNELFDQCVENCDPKVMQEVSDNVDLEQEVISYFQGMWPDTTTAEGCNTQMSFTPPAIMRLATHFYELGKEDKR